MRICKSLIALLVLALMLIAPSSSAVAAQVAESRWFFAEDGWTYSGVVTPPGRGSNVVRFNGDVSAPPTSMAQGYPLDICLFRPEELSAGVPFLTLPPDHGCLTGGKISAGGTLFVDGELRADSAGTFMVAASFFSRDDELAVHHPYAPLAGVAPVTIVLAATKTSVTRPSAASVISGDTVTLTAVSEVHWTDGTTSDEPLTERNLILQGRHLGASGWTNIDEGNPCTGTLTDSADFRFLVDESPTPSVFVTAIKPTSQVRFVAFTADKTRVFKDAPIHLSFRLETLYDDSQWRPTRRQSVEIQYSASKSSNWKTVSSAWVNRGEGSKNVRASATGNWRARTSASASSAVFIRVLKR